MSILKKADEITLVFLLFRTPILIVLILMFALIKDCTDPKIDPMDNSINKSRRQVSIEYVVDNQNNGFALYYATTNAVTEERLEEIRSRKHIQESFTKLQQDALKKWNGDLLDTDICDFALFARQYINDKDIHIHKIFVYGITKMNLYVQPNPDLPDCATWMDYNTEQGNQYLEADDINLRIPAGKKIYRYWKCDILRQRSDTDERFSHFTESERIR